jgi:hypothetical protein
VAAVPAPPAPAAADLNYFKARGVPEKKLFILTGGVDKWPYRTMLEAGK